jgi:hypothetical protein
MPTTVISFSEIFFFLCKTFSAPSMPEATAAVLTYNLHTPCGIGNNDILAQCLTHQTEGQNFTAPDAGPVAGSKIFF